MKQGDAGSRHRRRWTFANCTFDEASWSLEVAGRRVAIETKPLELLRVLLLNAGSLVSKDELLEAVWPEVTVVEASLPTAIRKLRHALGNDRIIETVSGLGYRLAVPVEMSGQQTGETTVANESEALDQRRRAPAMTVLLSAIGGVAATLVILGLVSGQPPAAATTATMAAVTKEDIEKAVREFDQAGLERMLAGGWDAATVWDREGTDAMTILLNRCEWDRAHDRREMLLFARTLIDAGAPIDRRNRWGDTIYSIAKARRYCGPDHPVTQMVEAMCYGGSMGPRDLCLATYELSAEQRRAQGLPPKG